MPKIVTRRLGLAVASLLLLMAQAPAAASSAAPELTEGDAAELILRSLGLLGIEYRLGGNTPASGMDCSGFVRYVYREALGLTLPRRADEMSTVGTPLTRSQLKPGDLVFFNTLGRPFSHVGLYMGSGRFVHAPSTGNVIRVEPLATRYWAQRFEGGRRIPLSNAVLARDQGGLDRLIQERTGWAAASASPAIAATASPAPASASAALLADATAAGGRRTSASWWSAASPLAATVSNH